MSEPANPAQARGAGSQSLTWLIFMAYLALLGPVALAHTPPLLDYANHNVRLWLIAGGVHTPPMDQIYRIDWSRTSTTIGIDLIAAGLGPIVGRDFVGPVCVGLSVLLPPLGAMLLHRRVFGAPHAWQFAMALPAFGKTVLSGFMNFNIGLGVAFLGGAADAILVRAGPIPAFLGRLAITVLCLMVHPYAAMCYGGVILGLSLGREVRPLLRWDGIRARILPGLLVVAPTVAAVVLLFVLVPHAPGNLGQGHAHIAWEPFSPRYVAAVLMSGFHSYSLPFDTLTVLFLLGVVGAAAALRRLAVHGGLLLAGLAFVLVSMVMPTQIGDAYWLEFRAPIMAAYVLMAAVLPTFAALPARQALGGALAALVLARTALVGVAWVTAQSDIRAVREAVASVPPGSAILPLRRVATPAQRAAAPLGRYFGTVEAFTGYAEHAVIAQRSFVPDLFAIQGQQPLVVLGRFAAISQPWGGQPRRVEELDLSPQPPLYRYLEHWRRDFDYILLLNAQAGEPGQAQISPRDAELVADKGFAVLYRIRHEPPAAP